MHKWTYFGYDCDNVMAYMSLFNSRCCEYFCWVNKNQSICTIKLFVCVSHLNISMYNHISNFTLIPSLPSSFYKIELVTLVKTVFKYWSEFIKFKRIEILIPSILSPLNINDRYVWNKIVSPLGAE